MCVLEGLEASEKGADAVREGRHERHRQHCDGDEGGQGGTLTPAGADSQQKEYEDEGADLKATLRRVLGFFGPLPGRGD